MDKKIRGKNYSEAEKEYLLQIIDQYIQILENKTTNAVSNKKKNETWEKVAVQFNAIQTTGIRNAAQLKNLYEQMKKTARKNKADDKIEQYKTGGGQFSQKLTSIDEKVIALKPQQYEALEVTVDSDATVCMLSTEVKLPTTHEIVEEVIDIQGDFGEPQNMVDIEQPQSSSTHVPKKKKAEKEKGINDKKMEILNVMLEIEKEKLKGMLIENETKELQRESARIDLLIKQKTLQQFNL